MSPLFNAIVKLVPQIICLQQAILNPCNIIFQLKLFLFTGKTDFCPCSREQLHFATTKSTLYIFRNLQLFLINESSNSSNSSFLDFQKLLTQERLDSCLPKNV